MVLHSGVIKALKSVRQIRRYDVIGHNFSVRFSNCLIYVFLRICCKCVMNIQSSSLYKSILILFKLFSLVQCILVMRKFYLRENSTASILVHVPTSIQTKKGERDAQFNASFS
uniref:Uncharacterized protein n=1 Tax=Cacopsylla melanoneura TaxID=428564 RepID=A0A8D9ABV3_9HEMI